MYDTLPYFLSMKHFVQRHYVITQNSGAVGVTDLMLNDAQLVV